MSTHGLDLVSKHNENTTKHAGLLQSRHHDHSIEYNLFSHDVAEKNTHLALNSFFHLIDKYVWRDRRGRDCAVVGYTTTYAISAYHL